mmetsp:Transcript_106673/g.180094  ORF Transcript_106673/g.180094 Transcript_106673/m.180094 type:complete len:81 (+) Transcript_106673:85-327(+)
MADTLAHTLGQHNAYTTLPSALGHAPTHMHAACGRACMQAGRQADMRNKDADTRSLVLLLGPAIRRGGVGASKKVHNNSW